MNKFGCKAFYEELNQDCITGSSAGKQHAWMNLRMSNHELGRIFKVNPVVILDSDKKKGKNFFKSYLDSMKGS